MNKETVKYAFLASLPVMAGYVVLGIGFGLLLYDIGYGVPWAFLMSLCIYAGSMQYVGVGLIGSGASLIAAALLTVAVNARHIFYGLSMLGKYKKAGWKKFYLIFGLTDETYSLVCNPDLPEGIDETNYDFLVSLFDQSYWIIGSLIGSFLGSALPFDTTGVDFSMTALFVVIFVGQWEQNRNHLPALIGLGASIICLLIAGPDRFLLLALPVIAILLFLFKGTIRERDQKLNRQTEGK